MSKTISIELCREFKKRADKIKSAEIYQPHLTWERIREDSITNRKKAVELIKEAAEHGIINLEIMEKSGLGYYGESQPEDNPHGLAINHLCNAIDRLLTQAKPEGQRASRPLYGNQAGEWAQATLEA